MREGDPLAMSRPLRKPHGLFAVQQYLGSAVQEAKVLAHCKCSDFV